MEGVAEEGVLLAGPNGGRDVGTPGVVPLYAPGFLNKLAYVFGSAGALTHEHRETIIKNEIYVNIRTSKFLYKSLQREPKPWVLVHASWELVQQQQKAQAP